MNIFDLFHKSHHTKEELLSEKLDSLRSSGKTFSSFILFINGCPYGEVLKVIDKLKNLPTISLCIELSEGLFLVFSETNNYVGLKAWVERLKEDNSFEILAIKIDCFTSMAWCLKPEKSLILDVSFKAARSYGNI